MRQIVLDTETTGIEIEAGHRIIEIGCIELVNRKFTGKRFHQYINPERDIDEGALAVHGITKHFLLDKPVFSQIVNNFMDFVRDAELIIHNAPFDVGFINHELALTRQSWKRLPDYCQITDTLTMARQLHIGQRNNLDALCKRYSVDNTQRDLHGALLDAHLLAQVYLAMTGGQGNLFGETQGQQAEAQIQTNVAHSNVMHNDLRVIEAGTDELKEHELRLQKMLEKGKCVWLN